MHIAYKLKLQASIKGRRQLGCAKSESLVKAGRCNEHPIPITIAAELKLQSVNILRGLMWLDLLPDAKPLMKRVLKHIANVQQKMPSVCKLRIIIIISIIMIADMANGGDCFSVLVRGLLANLASGAIMPSPIANMLARPSNCQRLLAK